MDEEKFLKKFASILGDGAKEELEKIEQKKLKENKLLESFSKSLSKIADFEVRLEEELPKPKEVKLPSNFIKKPEKIVPPQITMEEPVVVEPEKTIEETPTIATVEEANTVVSDQSSNVVASATNFTSKIAPNKPEESKIDPLVRKEIDQLKKAVSDFHRLVQAQSQKSIIVQSGAGGGGEVNLKKLDDVDYSSLKSAVDGQVLTFNADTGKWQASDPTGGGGGGVRGYTGSQGYTGSAGINGYTGSAGTNGYTGSAGTNGYTGSQGPQGLQGNIGYTGSSGIQGENGSIGYTGSQGNSGFTGSSGTGYTGSAGSLTTYGTAGQLLSSNGSSAVWISKFYVGNVQIIPLNPNYGDIWFSTDDNRPYMWLNTGYYDTWYDFTALS